MKTLAAWQARQQAVAFAVRGKKRQREAELKAFVHAQLAADVGATERLAYQPGQGWEIERGQ